MVVGFCGGVSVIFLEDGLLLLLDLSFVGM